MVTVGCLVAVDLAEPVGALAVNVSSHDGSGTQSPATWYSNGAKLDGTLKSTSGNPVYYSGKVNISISSDVTVGRYTSNTTSSSSVTRGGTVSTVLVEPDVEIVGNGEE